MRNILQARSAGNVTVEYLFIASLTIAVSIGALLLLGENIQKALAGLKSDMTTTAAGKPMQRVGAMLVSTEIPSSTTPSDHQVLICTPLNNDNKMCMSVLKSDLGVDIDPSEKVVTMGSLGNDVTAQQFMDIISFAAEQLPPKEVENLTATLLQMLAETGYIAASEQSELGDICAQDKEKCQDGVMALPSSAQDANGIAAVEKKVSLTKTAGEMTAIKLALEAVVSKKPDTLTEEEKVTVAAITQEIITDAQDTSVTMVPKLINKTEPTDTNTDSAGIEQVSKSKKHHYDHDDS